MKKDNMEFKYVAAEGYLVKCSMRYLDTEMRPVSTWSHFYTSCNGSGVNPYLYTKKQYALQGAKKRGDDNIRPVRDYPSAPFPRPKFSDFPTWAEYNKVLEIWENNVPIKHYVESKTRVVPGKLVEVKENDE